MRIRNSIPFIGITFGLLLLAACQAPAPAAPGEKVAPGESTQAAGATQVNLPQDSAKTLPPEPQKNLPDETAAGAPETAGRPDREKMAETPSVEDSPTEEKATEGASQ